MLWTCNLLEDRTESKKTKRIALENQTKDLTAYHVKVRLESDNNEAYCNMSEDKDDLKSIKVYKFNNTKEGWHEFALKFRVIADSRGYDDIIEGMETPPDEKENLEIIDKEVRKA